MPPGRIQGDSLSLTNKKMDKQDSDKEPVYYVIRSMCSIALNAILGADEEFLAMENNDPLALLTILKRIVTTKCDGHVEHDRTDALTEWYNLRMGDNEDISLYSRRASNSIDRMKTTGIRAEQIPNQEQQAFTYIKGLNSRIPMYAEYKNYLSNALETMKQDYYPKTLTEAINNASRFHRGTKSDHTPVAPVHTSFVADEVRTPKVTFTPPLKPALSPAGKGLPMQSPRSPSPPHQQDTRTMGSTPHRFTFHGNCNLCGQQGQKESRCPARQANSSERIAKAAMASEDEAPYHSTFGKMYDGDEDDHTCAITDIHSSVSTGHNALTRPTEAIFDTGATGSIITNKTLLSDITFVQSTTFRGLTGDMDVKEMGTLGGIGRVYYSPYAGMSISSASECSNNGHPWEYKDDAFHLHTPSKTYTFHRKSGLYIGDITDYQPIVHKVFASIYTAYIPTTAELEALYSIREVKRSATSRRLQASLGFPPDTKLIRALRSGTFLNSDVLPEDVMRATHMWGPSIPAMKGRTVRARPTPDSQKPIYLRAVHPQTMHCDITYINKQAYLVSITHPVGMCQVACLDNVSTPMLRVAVRWMFGTLASRGITVKRFQSDNEKGRSCLFGDMAGMQVEAIAVGPGQHDHIIERMIRQLKETVRATIASLPFQVPDILMPHIVVSCTKKLILFPSVTRSDQTSAFEVFYGRKADAAIDIGPPLGTYCQVSVRQMTNDMELRTIGCIYLEPRMNSTGTHNFMRLDNRAVIGANHMKILPFSPTIITLINGWSSKNKLHSAGDATFTFPDQDITLAPPEEDIEDMVPELVLVPPTVAYDRSADPPDMPDTRADEAPINPYDAFEPHQPEVSARIGPFTSPPDDTHAYAEPDPPIDPQDVQTIEVTDTPTPDQDQDEENGVQEDIAPLAHTPPRREPSSWIRRPIDRLNLVAASPIQEPRVHYANMSVARALKLFPEKTNTAMEGEVRSLLSKNTFSGARRHSLTADQQKRILRSHMNVVEIYLPTLDETGNRAVDKVKARLCVDGRGQDRANYHITEIESPTANVASIFTIAQIAACEERFIMVGDVGTAYLDAKMPTDDPSKRIHMTIDPVIARIIITKEPSFQAFVTRDGGLLVALDKALYGCIESARLWNDEISSKLSSYGFTANPRDRCVFNSVVRGHQVTIVVYVDDLMITSRDKEAVIDVETRLRGAYGHFRTTTGKELTYLGCTWDSKTRGVVKIGQSGMIQDLVTSRERTHADRKSQLKGNPNSPAAPYIYDHTHDSPLLNEDHARIFHRDVATALYLGNRTRPDIVLTLGELCKRVKAPTEEDDRKLDRLISYLRCTRDLPLTLRCTASPSVTVSIDAAYCNREEKRSTTGMCMTLGTGKVQKTATKSSTEAEIVAVSDGMNIPLWLRDFISYQGYKKMPVRLEQDNMSCITLLQKGESTAAATKYIDVKRFWISDYIKRGEVVVQYVPTLEMTSDSFTKPLQGSLFEKLRNRIMGI